MTPSKYFFRRVERGIFPLRPCRQNRLMSLFVCGFVMLLCGVLFASFAVARSVSFGWIANSDSPSVDGYRLYYKIGDPGQTVGDYTGTDASGGNPSPVTVTGQNTTSYILPNLVDDQKYSFVLTAYRGADESDPTVAVTLAALVTNAAPVASNSSFATDKNTIYNGQLSATDADGDALQYSIVGNGSKGTAVVTNAATGAVRYTPNTNAIGSDSFTFRVNDGKVNSNTATVSVTINDTNAAPVASNSSFATDKNTIYNGQLSATDADGDALQYSIVGNGSKGTAVVTNAATGAVRYTPNTNAIGSDSFTFRVNDGKVNSNTATVSVTINDTNAAPVASNSSFATDKNTIYNGQLSATDADGDALQYSIVGNGSKGTAVVTNAATGAVRYTPNTNAIGSDSFTFRASDGKVNSNTATVSVTINDVNQQPQVSNSSFVTNEDTPYSGQLIATDADGDPLQYSIVTNGTKGRATVTNITTGAFTYTPNLNANGSDSFTFRVNDGKVNSVEATVNVTITPVNDAPIAYNSSFSMEKDTVYHGQFSAGDPDGDPLTYAIIEGASRGSVAIPDPASAGFIYTPNEGVTGTDSFTFRVNDGTVDSASGRVLITIFGANAVTAVFGDATATDYPGTLADAFTNINTDNNADRDVLSTYSWSATVPHKVANTIIIKADLTALPTYSSIIAAELQLYQNGTNGATEYSHTVHKITGKDVVISQVSGYNAMNGEPWTPVPTGTTHNDVPLGLADIDMAEATVILGTQSGYQSFIITAMVQQWVRNPAGNFGLLIKGEPTAVETGRSFASSENQNADIRPKLIIRYSSAPLPPQLIKVEEVK